MIMLIATNYSDYDNYTKNYLATTFSNDTISFTFTYEQLLDELNKYKSYILDTWRTGTDPDKIFINLFKSFKDMYLEQYQRIFKTITDSYNPLDNYNRDETTTETIKGTKTTEDSGKDDSKSTTPKTSTVNANITNDSDTMKDINKSTTGAVGTGGALIDIEQTSEVNYGKKTEESYSNDYEHKTTFKAHGNLGVQTMNEVGGGEIKFRAYKLFAEFVEHFIYYYGYYCESDED